MRWAMGLLDAGEIAMVVDRQRLLGEQAQATNEVERHSTFMNATLPALRARLGFGDGDLPDGFFAGRARQVAEQRIQSLEGQDAHLLEGRRQEWVGEPHLALGGPGW
jgi:hypothetical protein